jgi:hypothetical protein
MVTEIVPTNNNCESAIRYSDLFGFSCLTHSMQRDESFHYLEKTPLTSHLKASRSFLIGG